MIYVVLDTINSKMMMFYDEMIKGAKRWPLTVEPLTLLIQFADQ